MKPALLVYNAGAGSAQGITPENLTSALRDGGYDVQYRPTSAESDLDAVLTDFKGTVFVAGGDGTVRGVALRLLGQSEVQLGVIPLGTSNNIGRTLNLSTRPLELARQYAAAHSIPFDAGRIEAPWGKDYFIEACGCGLFADVLSAYDPEAEKSPVRALQAVISIIPGYEGQNLAVRADGASQPLTRLTLVEVMNIRATGNSMKLGTNADPTDGRLDVVTVDAQRRDGLLNYLSALASDHFVALPSVVSIPAKSVEIPYLGQAFHIDDKIQPALIGPQLATGSVRIEVWTGALQMLVPDY